MIDPLLFAATRVRTFVGSQGKTGASGFFFRRDERLFLVTSRHVMLDEATRHRPDRIEIEVHRNRDELTSIAVVSIDLYHAGTPAWRDTSDAAGPVDVAVIELDRATWPADAIIEAFEPRHLVASMDDVRIGAAVLVTGYPLGFHDTVYHLPVVRLACVASAFGVRFQGRGYFLTDSRTHHGSSGAPVVLAQAAPRNAFGWKLLGVHSSRLDMSDRDRLQDESLGLNSAWYADVLMVLTQARSHPRN